MEFGSVKGGTSLCTHPIFSVDNVCFIQKSRVELTRLSNRSVEFDMVGVDASIANAYRRVMIAEVPSVCIEHVYVWDNTSVMQDEVLAQRLGLIPLNADASLFEMRDPGAFFC